MFGVSVIATDPEYYFVQQNCTQIKGCLHFYEGETQAFDHEGLTYEVLGVATVPSLGGLTKDELIKLVPMKREDAINLEREKREKLGIRYY